jgi:hypothetical protein
LKSLGKRHPAPARPRDPERNSPASDDQARGLDTDPHDTDTGPARLRQTLRTTNKHLNRAGLVADIVNALTALADLFRL